MTEVFLFCGGGIMERCKLPDGTTVENILCIMELIKKYNGNDLSVKNGFNRKGTTYVDTKSAMRIWGIMEQHGTGLTVLGEETVFGDEKKKKDFFKKLLMNYKPYSLVIEQLIEYREDETNLQMETVEKIWESHNLGKNDRNRKEAACLFGGVMDFAEFGKYIKGSRRAKSHIICSKEQKQQIINMRNNTLDYKTDANNELKESNGDTYSERVVNEKTDINYEDLTMKEGKEKLEEKIEFIKDMAKYNSEKNDYIVLNKKEGYIIDIPLPGKMHTFFYVPYGLNENDLNYIKVYVEKLLPEFIDSLRYNCKN